MTKGLDTPDVITVSSVQQMQSDGIEFVARYYSADSWKCLTPHEAMAISGTLTNFIWSPGLFIVSVYEDGPTDGAYFSSSRGSEDGDRAVSQAAICGQPKGTPIYATVDYDAVAADIDAILAYAESFHSTLKAAGYYAGWYASGYVLQAILNSGFGHFWWLSQSKGFTGYTEFLNSGQWNIKQTAEITSFGIDIDGDVAISGGGWKSNL